jgi:2-dehydro-3-deoxygluconokinase
MEEKPFDLITFGEIMLRLSPPRHARIVDGDIFEKRAGGAELNVASGVALLGLRTGIISRLPQNELGTFIKNRIRFVGVSDDFLTYDDSSHARLGIYYYEMGAAPRKPTIVYDRYHASVCGITMEDIPEEAFQSARMFHTSGISLALGTRGVAIETLRRFRLMSTTAPTCGARTKPARPLRAFCPWLTCCLCRKRQAAACSKKRATCTTL